MPKQPYLECGKIVNTHGLNGYVRVDCWCDTPEVLMSLPCVYFAGKDGRFTRRDMLNAFPHRDQVCLLLDGIDSINAAIPLKNTVIYAGREDLPLAEGAAFLADMLGLPVRDADSGRLYGKLVEVTEAPASALYDILTPGGRHVLFPAVPAFVDRIDTEDAVYIRPIAGFFDEDEGNGDAL